MSMDKKASVFNYLGQRPLLRTGLLAGGGFAAGRLGSDMVAKLMTRLMFFDKTPEERALLVQELDKSRVKNVGSALGTLAGLLVAQLGSIDTSNGLRNALKSMYDGDYYKKNPAALDARPKQLGGFVSGMAFPNWGVASGETALPADLGKEGSWESGFSRPSISLNESRRLVNGDPFLKDYQKQAVSSVFNNITSGGGIISQKQLAGTALKMGASFVPAYMFGRGVGAILGLPAPTAERISKIGGLAAAVNNSGIIGKY